MLEEVSDSIFLIRQLKITKRLQLTTMTLLGERQPIIGLANVGLMRILPRILNFNFGDLVISLRRHWVNTPCAITHGFPRRLSPPAFGFYGVHGWNLFDQKPRDLDFFQQLPKIFALLQWLSMFLMFLMFLQLCSLDVIDLGGSLSWKSSQLL